MLTQLGKGVVCGDGQPLVLIAGPCVIESVAVAEHVAGTMKEICGKLGVVRLQGQLRQGKPYLGIGISRTRT